jgi:hypothetical protein
MNQGNASGGTLVTPTGFDEHLAVDRAIPRAGDRFAYGGDEDTVRDIAEAALASPVPDPDASMDDPIVGINSRFSRHPFWATLRKGFEDDTPNLGKRAELVSPLAGHDPLQSMEEVPTFERMTFRIVPGPWDESLLVGR